MAQQPPDPHHSVSQAGPQQQPPHALQHPPEPVSVSFGGGADGMTLPSPPHGVPSSADHGLTPSASEDIMRGWSGAASPVANPTASSVDRSSSHQHLCSGEVAAPAASAAPAAGGGGGGGDGAASAGNADEEPTPAALGKAGWEKPTGLSLFVKGLDPATDFNHLEDYFKPFGELISCRVLRDAKTGASRCIGYVNFATPDGAANALRANGLKGPNEEVLQLQYADNDPSFKPIPPKKLFVRFVPAAATGDDVRRVYERFGRVVAVEVARDTSRAAKKEARGQVWQTAYVEFATTEDCSTALAATDRQKLMSDEHHLVVKVAEDPKAKPSKQQKAATNAHTEAPPPPAELRAGSQPPSAPSTAAPPSRQGTGSGQQTPFGTASNQAPSSRGMHSHSTPGGLTSPSPLQQTPQFVQQHQQPAEYVTTSHMAPMSVGGANVAVQPLIVSHHHHHQLSSNVFHHQQHHQQQNRQPHQFQDAAQPQPVPQYHQFHQHHHHQQQQQQQHSVTVPQHTAAAGPTVPAMQGVQHFHHHQHDALQPYQQQQQEQMRSSQPAAAQQLHSDPTVPQQQQQQQQQHHLQQQHTTQQFHPPPQFYMTTMPLSGATAVSAPMAAGAAPVLAGPAPGAVYTTAAPSSFPQYVVRVPPILTAQAAIQDVERRIVPANDLRVNEGDKAVDQAVAQRASVTRLNGLRPPRPAARDGIPQASRSAQPSGGIGSQPTSDGMVPPILSGQDSITPTTASSGSIQHISGDGPPIPVAVADAPQQQAPAPVQVAAPRPVVPPPQVDTVTKHTALPAFGGGGGDSDSDDEEGDNSGNQRDVSEGFMEVTTLGTTTMSRASATPRVSGAWAVPPTASPSSPAP